jgi:hypothetical protein
VSQHVFSQTSANTRRAKENNDVDHRFFHFLVKCASLPRNIDFDRSNDWATMRAKIEENRGIDSFHVVE